MFATVLADVFALSAQGCNLRVVDLHFGDYAARTLVVKWADLRTSIVGDSTLYVDGAYKVLSDNEYWFSHLLVSFAWIGSSLKK